MPALSAASARLACKVRAMASLFADAADAAASDELLLAAAVACMATVMARLASVMGFSEMTNHEERGFARAPLKAPLAVRARPDPAEARLRREALVADAATQARWELHRESAREEQRAVRSEARRRRQEAKRNQIAVLARARERRFGV